MKVVVAGGSGLLGTALIASLRADGHDIAVLTRRPKAPGDLQWSASELTTAARDAIGEATAVINLAGSSIADGRWTPARKADILDSRIRATEMIRSAIGIAKRPPGVLLNGSAIGFYGPHGNEPLNEADPAGSDFLARVCVEWEAAAQRAADLTRVVLLRTGVVLAREGGALPQLARPFYFFAGGPLGAGQQYVSWIHISDWVSMVRLALDDASVLGPLNLTAPQPVTNAELATALGRSLHRPAFLPTPAFALRLALGEMADALILNGQRVMPDKARATGFSFRFPTIDAALADIYAK